ncbi:hypothetical protein JCM6882_004891 [Rhodosporidiobolus microsporus]
MVDALVQFLLEEIAFDADAGTSLSGLSTLINQFYSLQPSPSSSSSPLAPAAAEGIRTQTVDDAFLAFVWSALVGQDDVRVGVVQKVKGKGKVDEAGEEGGEGDDEPKAEEQEANVEPAPAPVDDGDGADNPAAAAGPSSSAAAPKKKPAAPPPPPKKATAAKQKKKAAAAGGGASGATHTIVPLSDNEKLLPLPELREKYESESASEGRGKGGKGEGRLRVMVGEETAWAAITGSHAKISSLTPQIYSVLKMVARGREHGTTAVRISKEMGIEPKSVFHCIKVPTGLGITKKFADIDQGFRTNRVLHVRYLSRSPSWAVHVASEGGVEGDDAAAAQEGEDDDYEGGGAGGELMTPISAQYLASNRPLIKQRIVKALRRRRGGWMFHHEVAPSIGLHSSTPLNLRRLNTIITDLSREPGPPFPGSSSPSTPGPPLVEKVLVPKAASNPAAVRQKAGAFARAMNEGVVEGWGEEDDFGDGTGEGEEDEEGKGRKGKKGVLQVQAQVLRLVRRVKEEGAEDPVASTSTSAGPSSSTAAAQDALPATGQGEGEDEEDDDDDPSLYPVVGKTIERQILELLMNADKRGMTGHELSLSLSSFAPRFIDALLARLGRSPPPSHLSDHALHSVTETVGRVKQTRWFSLAGYLGFRREMGVVDGAREDEWALLEEAAEGAGQDHDGDGWSEVGRPWEGQYLDGRDADARRRTFNTMQLWNPKEGAGGAAGAGKKNGRRGVSVAAAAGRKRGEGGGAKGKGKAKEEEGGEVKTPATKKKASAKGKGKEKAVDQDGGGADDQDDDAANGDDDDDDEGAPPKPKSAKPKREPGARGRPRKNPLPPGVTESPYMRKKREKAEDEEREKAGLPPLVRERVKKPRVKKVKEEGKEGEEGKSARKARKSVGKGVQVEGEKGGEEQPAPSSSVAGGGVDGTPIPPPKKRGRPAKKVTSADVAGVSSSINAASPANGDAAEPSAPVASTSAAAGTPSQSRAGTPFIAASTPSRPLKRKLEPYVDIVVKSTPPAKRTKAGSETPASTKGKGKGKARDEDEGKETEVEMDDEQAPPSGAQGTPAPSGSAHLVARALGGFETPKPFGREGTPASTPGTLTKSGRRKDRPRKPIKDKENLTLLVRQQEVIEFTTAQGGIWAREPRSAEFVRDFVRDTKGDAAATQMDRAIFTQVLDNAVKRDVLRKTVGTDSIGRRRDIYFLPSIALDSQQAVEFLASVKQGQAANRYISVDMAREIGFEAEVDVSSDRRGKRGCFGGAEGAKSVTAPRASEDPETVREFFRNEPGILGRSHGVKNGLLARARQLHKWLASFVFAQPDDSDVVVLRDEHGSVLSQATLLNSMPIGVFVRIVPLAVESPALNAFLAEPENLQLPMSALPSDMDQLIKPRASKRKAAMWKILDMLVKLHLLERLVPVASEDVAFTAPVRSREVTHWRFRTTVPVYAPRNDANPLIAVRDLASNEDVVGLWGELQQGSDMSAQFAVEANVTHPDFPATLQTTNVFRKDLRASRHWRDSYQLSFLQRSFLVSLLEDHPDIIDDGEDRAAEIANWASCLFAPANVVGTYLRDIFLRRQKKAETKTRKRRKVVSGGEAAGWEDVEEDDEGEGEPVDKATALQRKVKGAAEQRERDWVGIVERFRCEHGQPDLDAGILDYLHRRFVDPRRQIDAVQLDFELRRLLPPPAEGAALAGAPAPAPAQQQQLKTVVPLALIRKARLAKDPYAISRQPNIRKRVRAVKSKNVQRAPAPPQQKQEPKPFTTGDQSEFLAVPLPPRPQLGEGQRLPRNFFSPEQDDLFLDAFAVLKARAKRLGMRIAWLALEQLFKGHLAKNLGVHAKKLIAKPEDAAYHDRLIEAWTAVYDEKKDELEDPNPGSMTQFDISACVRCLRENVDKRIIRLMRSQPEQLPEALALPASLDELDESYTLTLADAAVPHGEQWDKIWRKSHIASNVRDEAVSATPYAKVHHEPGVKSTFVGREKEQTAAALKMLLTTPEATYQAEQGAALLRPFEQHVDDVVKVLTDKHIIVRAHTEDARRLPGRNFSYDDRFFDRFDNRVDLSRLASASDLERDMHSDGFDGVFPLIPTEGEMMALFDLVSEGKAELSIDTSALTDKALRYDDYLTRQANDDDIECGIIIEPVQPHYDLPLPLPTPLLPHTFTDDAAQLEQARQLLTNDVDLAVAGLASRIESDLVSAGVNGVPFSELAKLAPVTTVLPAVRLLTHPTSGAPLALFAGSAALSVVSTSYLSSWTVALPKAAIVEDEQPRRVLPCLWIDLAGEVNLELWNRAVGWVKGELLTRAGMTMARITAKASKRNVLSAYEVQRILEALLAAGKVYRRRAGVDEVLKDDVLVDWQHDGWFVGGTFW